MTFIFLVKSSSFFLFDLQPSSPSYAVVFHKIHTIYFLHLYAYVVVIFFNVSMICQLVFNITVF